MVTRQLKYGDKAAAFNGFDQNNNKISMSDFKNTKLILYLYPKENMWLNKGYAVVGVSAD